MKNIIVISVFTGLCVMTTSCSDGNDKTLQPVATTVSLEGAIGVSARGVIGSGYDKELSVSFARQDETAAGSGAYGACILCPAVREGGKGNRPVSFTDLQLYPADGRKIRMQGYYPAKGDGVAADATNETVEFTVDGSTDIMATDCLTGDTYAPFTRCTFRHLLTQVQLVCYSRDAAKWGAVSRIEVVGVDTRQKLCFFSDSPSLAASSAAEIKNISVPDMPSFPLPEVAEGDDLPDPQGIVLLPLSSFEASTDGALRLRIVTSRDGYGGDTETVSDVSVGVKGGFQAGKSHVISLFFTGGSRIETAIVGVAAWTEHEEENIPI